MDFDTVKNTFVTDPESCHVSHVVAEGKANKVATAKTLWVPAVNNHGGFGRWVFVEVTDVEAAKTAIRRAVREQMEPVAS